MKKALIYIVIVFLSLSLTSKVAAASYSFSGLQYNKTATECINSLGIIIDTTGETSNAADMYFSYNPSVITIIDSDTTRPGIQIEQGDAFESYVYNQVEDGVAKVTAVTSHPITSQKLFAKIFFTSTSLNPKFTFDFDGVGQTHDSNISDTKSNLDLLVSVNDQAVTLDSLCGVSQTVSLPVSSFQEPLFDVSVNPLQQLTDSLPFHGLFFPFVCLLPLILLILFFYRTRTVMVIDSKTKERLSFVNIKFLDEKNFQIVHAVLTNKNGIARFDKKHLNSYVSIYERDYKFPSKMTDEKILLRIGRDHFHKVKYKDEKGNFVIFIDPTKE